MYIMDDICYAGIFHGVITWMDGRIDIAPETVYEESFAYEDAECMQLV